MPKTFISKQTKLRILLTSAPFEIMKVYKYFHAPRQSVPPLDSPLPGSKLLLSNQVIDTWLDNRPSRSTVTPRTVNGKIKLEFRHCKSLFYDTLILFAVVNWILLFKC